MNLAKAKKLAEDLMNKHGIGEKYIFKFDNAKRRFGMCNEYKKEISLSRTLVSLNNEKTVRDTILHEIAHALAGCVNGHNHVWQRIAIEIGCDGQRCYDSTAVVTPKKPYQGYCPTNGCTNVLVRHRRKKNLCCGKCYRETGEFVKLKWRKNK